MAKMIIHGEPKWFREGIESDGTGSWRSLGASIHRGKSP